MTRSLGDFEGEQSRGMATSNGEEWPACDEKMMKHRRLFYGLEMKETKRNGRTYGWMDEGKSDEGKENEKPSTVTD